MGQAAVDLPETPDAAPAPLTSADDLLAQMAGAEIDRMLAESDAELGKQEPANPAAEHNLGGAAAQVPADEAELNKLLESATADAKEAADALSEPAPATAPAVSPATPQTPADDYASHMDALFKELNGNANASPAAPAKPAAPPPGDAPAAHASTPAPAKIAPPLTTEQATTVAERAALAQPVPEPAQETLSTQADEKPSLVVRFLEILNSPFAACPDVLRDTLGKVAILTLMNSIGVLLYLYLFRR